MCPRAVKDTVSPLPNCALEMARRRRDSSLSDWHDVRVAPSDGLPFRAVPGFGAGPSTCDLVKDREGDLRGQIVHRSFPVEQDECLPGAAFAQSRPRAIETQGPVSESVPVHELARLRSHGPEPLRAPGGAAQMVQTDVGHGPDAVGAVHAGAPWVEFLDDSAPPAARAGEKNDPVADFESELRVFQANRRLPIRRRIPCNQRHQPISDPLRMVTDGRYPNQVVESSNSPFCGPSRRSAV